MWSVMGSRFTGTRLARGLRGAVLLVATVTAFACNPDEPVLSLRVDPTVRETGSFGLVSLLQSGPGLRLTGQFVAYENLHPDQVIRAIDPEIGTMPNEAPRGRCVELTGQTPSEPLDGDFSIDLLDAGNILVTGPEGTITVEPRDFPDMLSSVGGVVYSSGPGQVVPLGPDADIVVAATGGPEVGAFSASVPMPRRLFVASVDGIPPSEGRVDIGSIGASPMQVQWYEPDPSSDFFHIEIDTGSARFLCNVDDVGSFELPAHVVRAMKDGTILTLRRIKVRPFVAPGISEAELVTLVQDEVVLDEGP